MHTDNVHTVNCSTSYKSFIFVVLFFLYKIDFMHTYVQCAFYCTTDTIEEKRFAYTVTEIVIARRQAISFYAHAFTFYWKSSGHSCCRLSFHLSHNVLYPYLLINIHKERESNTLSALMQVKLQHNSTKPPGTNIMPSHADISVHRSSWSEYLQKKIAIISFSCWFTQLRCQVLGCKSFQWFF